MHRLVNTRLFQPNRQWMRIALCLLFLTDQQAVEHLTIENISEKEGTLIWKSFRKLIQTVLKNPQGRSDFVEKLLSFRFRFNPSKFKNSSETVDVWQKIHKCFFNDHISIGIANIGKGKSSSSLNDLLSDALSTTRTAPTASFNQKNRAHVALEHFTRFLEAVLHDWDLSSVTGPKPLPFLRTATTSSSVRVNFNTYFSICADISSCCRLKYLKSIIRTEKDSSQPHCQKSVLDYLFTPCGDTAAPLSQLLRQYFALVDESRFSGTLSESHKTAKGERTTSKKKKKNSMHYLTDQYVDMLEKPLCILLKYNHLFGFEVEALHGLLLPLASLGLWRAASQVLALIRQSRSDPEYGRGRGVAEPVDFGAMCFVVHNHHNQLKGAEVLQVYERALLGGIFGEDAASVKGDEEEMTWSRADLDDFSFVTPIHFAIRSGNAEFIKSFFEVFWDFPISLHSLMQCAVELKVPEFCATLASLSIQFQSAAVAHDQNYFLTLSRLLGAEVQTNGLSFSFFNAVGRMNEVSVQAALLFASKYSLKQRDYYCAYPYIVLQPRKSSSTSVIMIDGTPLPLTDFLARSSRAVAGSAVCPLLAGGYFSTGSGVLHGLSLQQRCGLEGEGEGDAQVEHMLSDERWQESLLAVNYFGCSALYSALRGALFEPAAKALSSALAQTIDLKVSDLPVAELSDESFIETDSPDGEKVLGILRLRQSLHLYSQQFQLQRLDAYMEYQASNQVREAEGMCKYLRSLRTGSLDYFVYGIDPFAVDSHLDILAVLMKQIEVLWSLISESNFLRLIQLSYAKGEHHLDSIVRSRQILTLLGIPFSRLGSTSVHLAESSSPRPPNHPQGTAPYEENSNLPTFERLTVEKLRGMLPWSRCSQVKDLVIGWVKSHIPHKATPLESSLFLHKALDHSFLEFIHRGCGMPPTYAKKNRSSRLGIRKSYFNYMEMYRSSSSVGTKYRLGSSYSSSSSFSAAKDAEYLLRIEMQPVRAATSNASLASIEAVDRFCSTANLDPSVVSETLQLAYLICDFARLLVVARTLASLTTAPIPNDAVNAAGIHPVDEIGRQIANARENQARLAAIVEMSKPDLTRLSEVAEPSDGLNARIRVCDVLSLDQLMTFFKFRPNISERFEKIRNLVVDGLVAMFSDLKATNMVNLLHSFIRSSRRHAHESGSDDFVRVSETFIKAEGSRNRPVVESDPGHDHLTPALQRALRRAAEKADPAEAKREVESVREGVVELLKVLKSLRISTFLSQPSLRTNPDLTEKPFPRLRRYGLEFPTFYRSYEGSLNSAGKMNKEEEESIVQMFSPQQNALQGPPSQRQAAKVETLANLAASYKVADILLEFLRAMVFLISASSHSYTSVYNYDLRLFLSKSDTFNPLCALCLARLRYDLPLVESRGRRRLMVETRKEEREAERTMLQRLSICDKLLSLGTTPCKADGVGRVPLAIAALTGQFRILDVLLKSSSQRDRQSMSLYPNLLWHVLMESPLSPRCRDGDDPSSYVSMAMKGPDWENFEACAILLLQDKFPVDVPVPVVSGGGAPRLSCLDLAVWKRMEAFVLSLIRRHDEEEEGDSASYSQELLLRHSASHSQKVKVSSTRSERSERECAPLSAVHLCNLWKGFHTSSVADIHNYCSIRSGSRLIERQRIVFEDFSCWSPWVKRHSELVRDQLKEPRVDCFGKELEIIRWVSGGADPNRRICEDPNALKDAVQLRFYNNLMTCLSEAFQLRGSRSSSSDAKMKGSWLCPIHCAAMLLAKDLEDRVASLDGGARRRRGRQIDSNAEHNALPIDTDFLHFIFAAQNTATCEYHLRNMFSSSPERLKGLLDIDFNELVRCASGGEPLSGCGSSRVHRVLELACLYNVPSAIAIVFDALARWSPRRTPLRDVSYSLESEASSFTLTSLSLLNTSGEGSSIAKSDPPHQLNDKEENGLDGNLFSLVFESEMPLWSEALSPLEAAVLLSRSEVALQLLNLSCGDGTHIFVPVPLALEAIVHGRVTESCSSRLLERALKQHFPSSSRR